MKWVPFPFVPETRKTLWRPKTQSQTPCTKSPTNLWTSQTSSAFVCPLEQFGQLLVRACPPADARRPLTCGSHADGTPHGVLSLFAATPPLSFLSSPFLVFFSPVTGVAPPCSPLSSPAVAPPPGHAPPPAGPRASFFPSSTMPSIFPKGKLYQAVFRVLPNSGKSRWSPISSLAALFQPAALWIVLP
jgi:hypothetical protein